MGRIGVGVGEEFPVDESGPSRVDTKDECEKRREAHRRWRALRREWRDEWRAQRRVMREKLRTTSNFRPNPMI